MLTSLIEQELHHHHHHHHLSYFLFFCDVPNLIDKMNCYSSFYFISTIEPFFYKMIFHCFLLEINGNIWDHHCCTACQREHHSWGWGHQDTPGDRPGRSVTQERRQRLGPSARGRSS